MPQLPMLEPKEETALMEQVYSIDEVPHQKNYSSIIARLLLAGDGLVAQKLLQPFEHRFVVHLLAGLLGTDRELREALVLYGFREVSYNRMLDHLCYMATSDVEASREPTPSEINGLFVQIWSDPRRIFSIQWISDFVKSSRTRVAWLTEVLIDAVSTAREIQNELEAVEQGNKKRLAKGLPTLRAHALLLNMKASIDVVTDQSDKKTIQFSLCSAVDLLYGRSDDYDVESWVKHALELADLDGGNVDEVVNYPLGFHYDYHRTPDLSKEASSVEFVEFLTPQFRRLFELADTFLKFLRACTAFDTDKHPGLKPWANSGLIPISVDKYHILPIVAASIPEPEREDRELYFREPFRPRYFPREAGSEPPKLGTLCGVDDESRAVIWNLFLDRVPAESASTWLPIPPYHPLMGSSYSLALGFLRPKEEMKKHLANLTTQEREIIGSVDFSDYLDSMGYYDMSLARDEYMGFMGLSKAVEIHSLAHLHFGWLRGSQRWPFYYSELM